MGRFERKNGVDALNDLIARVRQYRVDDKSIDPLIGCNVLAEPFFFARSQWIPVPSTWATNIVQGKTYDSDSDEGRNLWGKYLPVWPVFVVNDDPASLTFSVAVDDALTLRLGADMSSIAEDAAADIRRGYITTTIKQRIHQAAFRERVIDAYRQQCALCRLKHEELLDAAHILPDADPEGEPVVPNGIALCKLHHAAFDRFFLSVRPDYTIEIRRDVLHESDGPMLKHGLQGMHGQLIQLPSRTSLRPNIDLLARRHRRFLELAK